MQRSERNYADSFHGDDGSRDWDHDMWQVAPDRMLEAYPHLADANIDWKRAGRAVNDDFAKRFADGIEHARAEQAAGARKPWTRVTDSSP